MLQLGSCLKCNGDLVCDEDELRCLQCGKYYYPGRPKLDEPSAEAKSWTINSVIRANQRGDAHWHTQNRDIIDYLKSGRSTQEIAGLTSSSPRRIRTVRQRLNESDNP